MPDVVLNMAGGNLYLYQPLTVGTLEVIDAVNLQDQTGGNAPLDVTGNLTIDATVQGNGFISLVGSGDQTITSSAAAYLTYLNVANAGNVDLPTILVLYNGTLTGDGTFVGTVQFGINNGQSYFVNFAGSMPDVVLNMAGGNLYLYQPLNVTTLAVIGSVNLQDQSGNGTAPLDVTGNLTIDAPVQGNGFISLVGSGDQTITSSAAAYLTYLNVANSGNVDLPTTLVLYNGTLTGSGAFVGTLQFGIDNGQSFSSYFTGSVPDAIMNMAGGNLNLYQSLNVTTLAVIDAVNVQDQSGNGTAPLEVTGSITLNGDVSGNGFISLMGSSDQTITSTIASYLTNLHVANSGNVVLPTTLDLSNSGQLTGSGTFSGTVQFGFANGGVNYSTYFIGSMTNMVLNLNGGTLYLDEPLSVGGLDAIDSASLQDQSGNGSNPLIVTGNVEADAAVNGSCFCQPAGRHRPVVHRLRLLGEPRHLQALRRRALRQLRYQFPERDGPAPVNGTCSAIQSRR